MRIFSFLINVFPKFLISIELKKNNLIYLTIKKSYINFLLFFLKNSFNLRFKNFISICCSDNLDKKERFEVIYNLLSNKYNSRVFIKLFCKELDTVLSVSEVYKGSYWYEREVWDTFGVFFYNNKDLRRILTDYGFVGFPLRKDFPQTGYVEIRYDDEKKNIVTEPVELAQNFRSFNFHKAWMQIK